MVKAVKEAGMPSYRHHEPGDLFIRFNVVFPDTLPEEIIAKLEQTLPRTRTAIDEPMSANVEEVVLEDVDETTARRAEGEETIDEDDEDGAGQPHVQCANQ
jgi:DnaJ family protein A protein 2